MYTKIIRAGDLLTVTTYQYAPYPYKRRKKIERKASQRSRLPSSRRSDNLKSCKARLLAIVRCTLFQNGAPAFLTLTFRDIISVRESYALFTRFTQKLRRLYGEKLAYVAVPEFQKRGAVHFHCLVWGLVHSEVLGERESRRLANLWGNGFIDCILTDGSRRLAGYLVKYMTKALFDDRLIGKKAYTTSKNVARPQVVSIAGTLDDFPELKSELVGVDSVPLHESSFQTQWLGRAIYQRFSIQKI